MTFILTLLQGGAGALASYLAAHVLLCLVPAFWIAGALSALVPKETITRCLGRNTPKYISYPMAALAGSVLAVCSCTIVPLFAGIYKKGAGIGPAITFLFFAPAANILALSYTGVAIGADLAIARLVLSLAFGIGIGMIMALIFQRSDASHDRAADNIFAAGRSMNPANIVFLCMLAALLILGTLKLPFLTGSYFQGVLPIVGVSNLQDFLNRIVPFDAAKGEEGVSVQGLLLIALLALIAVTAWRGLNDIVSGFNRWTWVSLAVTACTLFVAALRIEATSAGLVLAITGRTIGVGLSLAIVTWFAATRLDMEDAKQWLSESWWFVKKIFPLLVVGVFAVGVMRQIIRPEWIRSLAGDNTVTANLAGVLFGVFMYFPTLVEVPIAKMFLSLGMHRGPLLAYLIADPELSLQSILMISVIIGRVRAWTYVVWVALFSTLSGLTYGAWVNGTAVGVIGLYVLGALVLLAAALWFANRVGASDDASATEATEPND